MNKTPELSECHIFGMIGIGGIYRDYVDGTLVFGTPVVTFAMLDDPTRDTDALLDEYLTGYFGAAAAPIHSVSPSLSNPMKTPTAPAISR